MLSPKTQTNLANAKGYFEEHLCAGDYYSESGRVEGTWMGEGAIRLGLSGAVTRDAFVALCDNQHPFTGQRLTQRQKTTRHDSATDGERANRRVFFDFTFSPPKSVSIAGLVANDVRIVEAHRAAISVAVTELEQFAAARLRQGGVYSDRQTSNVVAALFEHETSRALDPHLHTHCIIFNATHDSTEERWKAVENHDMLAAQKFVENVYYHELARSLRGFGYTVRNSARGDFELAEIAPALRERFSKRHRQIDEQTDEFVAAHPELKGANIQAIREHLAHKGRDRKQRGISDEQLREYWSEQLTVTERRALRIPTAAGEPEFHNRTAADAVSWAEEHLFERRSVVREHELWRHSLTAARGADLTIAELKHETNSRGYLRAGRDKVSRRDVLVREWAIVEAARTGVGRCVPLASASAVEESELAPDQLLAFRRILRSTDFITLFRGGAGTGKSFVLRRIQDAVRREGGTTRVVAPQRQQVVGLGWDGLQDAQTVAELLQRGILAQGTVVIVDEAGQISGRQMFDLIRLVREASGRVILSGDTRQHGPVEASDALRAIERYSGLQAAELGEIRRQDPKRAATLLERKRILGYRQSVEAAAQGDLDTSFRRLEKLGAVVECGLGNQREKLAEAYLDLTARGESAIVVSQTRAEVRDINEVVRKRLRAAGVISGSESKVDALEAIDLTTAQKAQAQSYPPDALVVFNREVRGCPRGSQGRVVGISPTSVSVEVVGRIHRISRKVLDRLSVCRPAPLDLCSGDKLQLKANGTASRGEKLANGEIVGVAAVLETGAIKLADGRVLPTTYRQFNRGYAVTSYGSQGKTVDHVLFADAAVRAATNAQQWYVTISRGRKGVTIFTADKEQLRRAIARAGDRELALDLVPCHARSLGVRRNALLGLRRGREFARRVCRIAMQRWTAAFVKKQINNRNETPLRNQQTNRPDHANVLAT
jgi:conjugative relaxase-like TrwC/TraI family protein